MSLTASSLERFMQKHEGPNDELWVAFQRDGELIREKVIIIGWDAETRSVTFRGESTRRKIVYADQSAA